MLTPKAKTKILENFYAIDYAFFGKPISEMQLCCPILYEEYLALKGALLSTVIEMYDLIKYRPQDKPILNTSALTKSARKVAREARSYSKKLVATPSGKKAIQSMLREDMRINKNINLEQALQDNIRKKAFSIAIDNILIGRTVNESKDFTQLDSFNGTLQEKSYKLIRSQLVETAYQILDDGILE